jgi:hypothetical protein
MFRTVRRAPGGSQARPAFSCSRGPAFGWHAAGAPLLALSVTGLLGGAVTGCADEAEPSTWVKRLDDTATRAAAVSRLIQFYEDKVTGDKHDKGVACTSDTATSLCQSRECDADNTCKLQVKPLLELIMEPLTQRCVAADLDDRTNSKLIKLLADTRDPKAEPCLIKTLKDYKVDTTEDDVRNVARAVGAMKLKAAAGPLFDVFTKIHASKPKAQPIYRDIHDAMIALEDPSWESQLITYIGRPADQKDQAVFTDEMFWQITAVELLGQMKSANAVNPLLKLMLAPAKVAGQGDAVLALVKIGKPAIAPTIALLRGDASAKDLIEYSKGEVLKAAGDKPEDKKNAEKAAGTAHIGAAALVLATIGREETSAPLVEALGKADNDVAKAIMARELTKVPKTAQTVQAFRDTFDKLPVALSIPNSRGGAREVLLDVAPNFFDSTFVPWIAKSVKDMKGSDDDLGPIRAKALEATIKLATKDQVDAIDDLAKIKSGEGTLGKEYDKEIKLAKGLLTECSDKVDCYVGKLTDPTANSDDKVSVGVKAAYLIGELDGANSRAKVMAAYPKITHPSIRFAALTMVDAFSPKGDVAVATQLQKIVDDANATKDPEKMRFNSALKQFIYRLQARAQ